MEPTPAVEPDRDVDSGLLAVLNESKQRGFLGKGSVIDHIAHARAMLRAVPLTCRSLVDLGSGGGIPGLIVALDRPEMTGVLLDGSTRRGAFLDDAVTALGLERRIVVVIDRAEVTGHSTRRGQADVVLSRSFGAPAVVAECAAPLLAVGGMLIVSDPPASIDTNNRWPARGVARVGLRVVKHEQGPPAFTVLEQVEPCPMGYPRRVGVPAKRPLF